MYLWVVEEYMRKMFLKKAHVTSPNKNSLAFFSKYVKNMLNIYNIYGGYMGEGKEQVRDFPN